MTTKEGSPRELAGRRIASLVDDGFDQVEMTTARAALEAAGAEVFLVSPRRERVRGWRGDGWGDDFDVDRYLADAIDDEYDGLLVPGGVFHADRIRVIPEAHELVTTLVEQHRPIGAMSHGPWLLVDADVVAGRIMTSWPTIRRDLEHAGVDWVDEAVVVDRGIVTCRRLQDVGAFSRKFIALFARMIPMWNVNDSHATGGSR